MHTKYFAAPAIILRSSTLNALPIGDKRSLDRPAKGSARFISKSHNGKLARVDKVSVPGLKRPKLVPHGPICCATYASIFVTCPRSCPFKGNGCYVETGATKGLAKTLDAAAQGHSSDVVIAEEAYLISQAFRGGRIPQDGAQGGRDIRVHVGGDISSAFQAGLLADAIRDYQGRGGGLAWSFSHSWRVVPREAWGLISALASVETPEDIELARKQGYASAIVVDEFPSKKPFRLAGATALIIPCLAETMDKTCVECRLCLDDRSLFKKNMAIAFEAHGSGAKQVKSALLQLRLGKDRGLPAASSYSAPSARSSS